MTGNIYLNIYLMEGREGLFAGHRWRIFRSFARNEWDADDSRARNEKIEGCLKKG